MDNFYKDFKTREDYINYLRNNYRGTPEILFGMLADRIEARNNVNQQQNDI